MAKSLFEIPVRRIELPKDNWVEVSAYETEGEFQEQLNALGKRQNGTVGESATTGQMAVALASRRIIVLTTRIKNWSFDAEVTEENILSLPNFIVQQVMDKIQEIDDELEDPEIQKKYLS